MINKLLTDRGTECKQSLPRLYLPFSPCICILWCIFWNCRLGTVDKFPQILSLKVHEVDREITVDGDTIPEKKEANKEEYETMLDEEFIKIEKEVGDVKENSHQDKPIEVEETPSGATNISLLEAEDKIKSLELQLETISGELHHSESENAHLKSEVDLVNGKLKTVSGRCEELELEQKKMKEEISTAEQQYNLQLASHQEALGALDIKHKELGDLNETFSGVSAELENSRKKLEELDAELASSTSETHKLEEQFHERSSHAESESKRASELERMLELANEGAKDLEDQIGNLQEELKGLYNQVSQHVHVDEELSRSKSELLAVQEKLKLSESQVAELEQKFVSKEDVVQELTRELDFQKFSQEKMKEELLALEDMLSSSKDDIQSKIINLEEVELKLQEEVKTREAVGTSLKTHEMQISSLKEELEKLTAEKEALLSTVTDLKSNLSLTKEFCGQLEEKFHVADQNFNKTDALLLQALSYNADLEHKLKLVEESHGKSKMVAETASQRNIELEGLVQSFNAAEEELKEQLGEKEVKLISSEQKNVELGEQIARAELNFSNAESEIKGLSEKISELTEMKTKLEVESDLSKGQLQEYKVKISQLELSLSEAEDAGKKVGELELLLEASKIQAQDLEQQLSIAEAHFRDAELESKQYSSRVSELSTELEAFKTKSASLEIVVQAANEKEKELTDTLNETIQEKKKFEDLSNLSSEKILQAENFIEVLQKELKFAQEKLESIKEDIKAAGIRENEILEKLKSAEEQLEHQGRAAEQASARCLELESAHASLRTESEMKHQEAISSFTQKDSEVKQLQEKIITLEEQIAIQQGEAVEATEKILSVNAELEGNAEKLVHLVNTVEKHERKISESEAKLEQSFSENELLAGTNSQLRSELEAHQSKVKELNELLISIEAEKEATAEQLVSHVKSLEELSHQHSRGLELHSASELRIKETEVQLHDALEKIAHRDSDARGLNEKLLALEAQLRMYEEQLGELTADKENRRNELEEALLKIQNLEKCIQEAQIMADQLETENEGLAQANMIQTQQLATNESKMNELEVTLSSAKADKEGTSLQLHSLKKTIDDLTQQLASDGDKLQSQIYSLMEENGSLNKMYENSKEELQSAILQLEEQKAREITVNSMVENLNSEIASMKVAAREGEALLASRLEERSNILREKDVLNEQLNELQRGLSVAHSTLASRLEEHSNILREKEQLNESLCSAHSTIAEQKELESRMKLDIDAARKNSLEELEAEHQQAILLEKQVEELKEKLHLAETQHMDKVAEGGKKIELLNVELDDLKHKVSQSVELEKKIAELQRQLENAKSSKQAKDGTEGSSMAESEVTSRDFDLSNLSKPEKKSKKKIKGVHQAIETTPVAPPSGLMAFKFILGVALVSVIIGIILGKKY